jgi:starch phosphorylase
MVQDYIQRLYVPAAASRQAMIADNYTGAKELAAWKSWVVGAWKNVGVRHVDSNIEGDPTLGGTLQLRAEVTLSGLRPSDVTVEAVFGPVDADNRLTTQNVIPLELADERDGTGFFTGDVPLRKAGPFGYTVRVLPSNPLLAGPAELALVSVAH